MRFLGLLAFVFAFLAGAMSSPFPQHAVEEAVRQAQAMQLLPPHAVVDKTAPGIEVAYMQLGPNERVDLAQALGGAVPLDVIASLESQVDSIGRH